MSPESTIGGREAGVGGFGWALSGTGDMVVLDYKTPGECNACPAAEVTSVRYQWRGDHVEVLDPLPPV